jgi:hypothetical protein
MTGFFDYITHNENREKQSGFKLINLLYSMASVLSQLTLLAAWKGLIQGIV